MARRRSGGAKPPLGTGERFRQLVEELRKRGAKNPRALAAWIGRQKYGARRMAELAARGRRRRASRRSGASGRRSSR